MRLFGPWRDVWPCWLPTAFQWRCLETAGVCTDSGKKMKGNQIKRNNRGLLYTLHKKREKERRKKKRKWTALHFVVEIDNVKMRDCPVWT